MKTFIICSQTNYNLMVHVVNAETSVSAAHEALMCGAWDGCTVHEIDTVTEGVVFNQ